MAHRITQALKLHKNGHNKTVKNSQKQCLNVSVYGGLLDTFDCFPPENRSKVALIHQRSRGTQCQNCQKRSKNSQKVAKSGQNMAKSGHI